MNQKKRIRIAALLLALIVIAAGIFAAPAEAANAAEAGDTAYIVKRNAAAGGQADQSAPFEVVSEAEMIRLRNAGLLEWYEPDGVMTFGDDPGFCHSEGACDRRIYTSEQEILRSAQNDSGTFQWNLEMIGASAAFETGNLGQGVRIGVVDSGINPHPDLAGRLTAGCNYIEDADKTDTADRYGHGTLVAGLIAGRSETGATGTATEAELVPLKVTDGKAILVSTVCRAIYGGIDDCNCSVLNLSLGIRTDSQALREAVEYAEQKGVIIVSAVGNNGNAGIFYPASYEMAIGVGAVDETGTVYYHSNQNDSVFLTAPGANIKTTGRVGGYTNASGTSFAVPHVTAAVAVLRGIDPELTPSAIRELLSQTATDRGAEGWDKAYGWGIVNIGESLRVLTEETPPDDPPPDSPSYADCPKDDTCPMAEFTDVDRNAWYHDGVHWALDEGVMVGTGDAAFSPNKATTRAMLVTMLWRMEGEPEPTSTETDFTDLEAESWYEKAVLWAAETGITAGTSATTFSPNAKLSREQLATFLRRYAAYKELDVSASADLSGYTDAGSISDFALESVRWAVAVGIISGTSATTLSPKKSATRAEVASMLMRYHTNN